jgi:hypothetical protein
METSGSNDRDPLEDQCSLRVNLDRNGLSGGFQAGDLKLTSSVPFAEPDAAAVSGTVEAINVGEVYAELVRDLHNGTYKTPGFQHALHNARLIEAVMHSADQGVAGFTPFAR